MYHHIEMLIRSYCSKLRETFDALDTTGSGELCLADVSIFHYYLCIFCYKVTVGGSKMNSTWTAWTRRMLDAQACCFTEEGCKWATVKVGWMGKLLLLFFQTVCLTFRAIIIHFLELSVSLKCCDFHFKSWNLIFSKYCFRYAWHLEY